MVRKKVQEKVLAEKGEEEETRRKHLAHQGAPDTEKAKVVARGKTGGRNG